jgi:hypothetical protein
VPRRFPDRVGLIDHVTPEQGSPDVLTTFSKQ